MPKPCSVQCAAVVAAALTFVQAHAQNAPDPTRGQLLYATHCVECHNSQMHWRDKRLASDWASLKAQVTRWQAVALLNWGEADIVAVTRHLNQVVYRFKPPADRRGARSLPDRAANAAAGRGKIPSTLPLTQAVVWPVAHHGWAIGTFAAGRYTSSGM